MLELLVHEMARFMRAAIRRCMRGANRIDPALIRVGGTGGRAASEVVDARITEEIVISGEALDSVVTTLTVYRVSHIF
jgi:hypothetical protein